MDNLLEQVLANTQNPEQTASSLLDKILDNTSAKTKAIESALQQRIGRLEALLPENLRPHAERLVRRATLTFNRNENLWKCPTAEFVRCVLEAAELGLAIDGKLCNVVNYGGKQPKWQVQPDYKGLIAVAKMVGAIEDVHLDVIYENDEYLHEEVNGKTVFRHKKVKFGQPRGDCIGAYCRVILPSGRFKVVDMDIAELEYIRKLSPAKSDYAPWAKFTDEMRKKTVCKRALKLEIGDPVVGAVLDAMDRAHSDDFPHTNNIPDGPPIGKQSLRKPSREYVDDEGEVHEEPPEIDPDESDKSSLFDDLSAQIGTAEKDSDLTQIAWEIDNQRPWLGSAADELDKQIDTRRKQLQADNP